MRALVIGASGGLGAALVAALSARGEVTGLSRSREGLDVTDEARIAAVLGSLAPPYDLVIVATGALTIAGAGPEKTLRALDADALARQFAVNAAGPALVLKHALGLMPRDRRAVFAALSARVGSIGDNALGGWYGYRAAKAALNQLLRTAAIEITRTHPQAVVAALHPGTVDTALGPEFHRGRAVTSPAEAAAQLLAVIDALTPEQSGGFFDYAGRVVPW